jgi:hypothetical protein
LFWPGGADEIVPIQGDEQFFGPVLRRKEATAHSFPAARWPLFHKPPNGNSVQAFERGFQLSYLVVVGGVLLFQAAFSYAIIMATTGNGSFVGLGAMLFAVMGIPVTAIANLVLIHTHRKNPAKPYIGRLLLLALALPLAQLALLILVSVFRL